jgi:hypothetical protein
LLLLRPVLLLEAAALVAAVLVVAGQLLLVLIRLMSLWLLSLPVLLVKGSTSLDLHEACAAGQHWVMKAASPAHATLRAVLMYVIGMHCGLALAMQRLSYYLLLQLPDMPQDCRLAGYHQVELRCRQQVASATTTTVHGPPQQVYVRAAMLQVNERPEVQHLLTVQQLATVLRQTRYTGNAAQVLQENHTWQDVLRVPLAMALARLGNSPCSIVGSTCAAFSRTCSDCTCCASRAFCACREAICSAACCCSRSCWLVRRSTLPQPLKFLTAACQSG